ncbi:MAG: flagellar filament capping protein FliD, partial [Armatimonadota bacterium]
LQAISDKINLANTGITSTVVTSTSNGKTTSQLQLSGAGVPSGITDTNGMLSQIGVMQRTYGNELQHAQDASFTVDGLALTSATNQVSTVIPGATINLLKKNSTATISLSRDVTQIKSAITSLQNSFNSMVANAKSSTSYDSASQTSGPLFGDQTVQTIQQSLNNLLFSTQGSGTFTNLTQIGIGIDQDGKMSIDDTKLSNALSNNLSGVMNLLTATGSTSDAQLSYVSSNSKTLSSGTGGYSVNITQPATKAHIGGSVAQTSSTSAGEILSFGGQMFGGSAVSLTLDAGMNASDIVSKINTDSRLKDYLVASLDNNGKLVVDSKRYGASGTFTLSSNLTAGTGNSGIGTTPTSVAGFDVAGTINGEVASGSGQYLLGSVGNVNTEGLQIQYTGSSTGLVGTVNFSRGAANSIQSKLNSFLDSVNGLLTIQDKSLQAQVDTLTKDISDAQTSMTAKEQFYRDKFTAMES